jgi:hypothetical protein
MEGVMESDKSVKFNIFACFLIFVVALFFISLSYFEPENEGSVLLINFRELKNKGNTTVREKSEKDVEAIKTFCQKQKYLLIEISCRTRKNVLDAIAKYGNDLQRTSESCSLIFIGSDGNEGYICVDDGKKVYIQEVVNTINRTKYLRQQYTLLIVQACRGEEELTISDFDEDTFELKRLRKSPKDKSIVIPPTMSKFYLVQSTQPGTKSKRGYFAPRFFKLLSKYALEKDVVSIFEKVLYYTARTTLNGGLIQLADFQYVDKEKFFLRPYAMFHQLFRSIIASLCSSITKIKETDDYNENLKQLKLPV